MGTTLKALSLLNLFSTKTPELGLTQVTRLSGLNKATALRLLGELCEFGLLEQSTETKRYRLGSTVLRLANQREMAFPTRMIARPMLRDCAQEVGETVHMSLLDRFHLNTVAVEETLLHSVRVVIDPSEILPLHATASGLVVTAFGDGRLRRHLECADLQQFTSTTITSANAVTSKIDEARAKGFAISDGSFEEGVRGFARPLFGADQLATGAVAVAIPESRLSAELEEKCLNAVERAARSITNALGGQFPPDYPGARC